MNALSPKRWGGKITIIFVLMALLLVGFFAYKNYRLREAQEEYDHYTALYRGWRDPAQNLQEKSGDPDAKLVLDFLDEAGGLAKPVKDPALVAQIFKGKTLNFFIIPLGAEDKDTFLAQKWQNEEVASVFMEGNPGYIALKNGIIENGTLRGLILIHEATHAFNYYHDFFFNINDKEEKLAADEYKAYQVELHVLNVNIPEFFQSSIDDSKWMKSLWLEKNELPLYDDVHFRDQIRNIFVGEQLSDLEEGTYANLLWMNGVFTMFDRLYQDDVARAVKEKTRFILKASQDGINNFIYF